VFNNALNASAVIGLNVVSRISLHRVAAFSYLRKNSSRLPGYCRRLTELVRYLLIRIEEFRVSFPWIRCCFSIVS